MHTILVPVLIVMGILLLVAYARLAKSLENEPADSKAVRANQGLYTMGIMFLMLGLTLTFCNMHCQCQGLGGGNNIVIGFLALLGVVLIGLSATIINADVDGTKGWASFLLVLGILFVLGCGAMIYLHASGKLAGKLKFGMGGCGMNRMSFACY